MKFSLKIAAICISATLVSSPLIAQDKQPTPEEKAFKFRTSLFQTFSWKFGQLVGAKMKDDEAAFGKHKDDLVYLSSMLEEGFQIPNSIPEGSDAKPEIWQDYDAFKEKAEALATITGELIMADFDPRGFGSKACGSCHRDFRVKRDQ